MKGKEKEAEVKKEIENVAREVMMAVVKIWEEKEQRQETYPSTINEWSLHRRALINSSGREALTANLSNGPESVTAVQDKRSL